MKCLLGIVSNRVKKSICHVALYFCLTIKKGTGQNVDSPKHKMLQIRNTVSGSKSSNNHNNY